MKAFQLAPVGKTTLSFEKVGAVSRGVLVLSEAGHLVLSIRTPRPMRLWIGRHLLVDENPQRDRTHIFRRIFLAAMAPLEAGEHEVRLELGERSRHIHFVEEDCPGRGRDAILAAVSRAVPDEIAIDARFQANVSGPAACLRFEPGQFRSGGEHAENGQVFQDVWIHRLAGFDPFPAMLKEWGEKLPERKIVLSTPFSNEAMKEVATWPGQAAGDTRAYVAVTAPGAELPPARQTPNEDRPESMRAVVGEVELSISDSLGAVSVPMPIFEGLGRLAPKRFYREVDAPVFEKVWAAVPKPILPPAWVGFGAMYEAAWRMLCRLWQTLPHTSGMPNGYVRTSEQGFENLQFVWDTCFTTTALAYGWRAYPALASLNCLYARQEDGGHIERECDVRDNRSVLFEPGFGPNPPLIAVAEWAVARLSGDLARLAQVLPALEAQFAWLVKNRRLPDGTFWTTGLANGLDNSPSLGEGYPCLTGQMAHFAEMLAVFCQNTSREADAKRYRALHGEIAAALNQSLWSDALGCYSSSLAGGGHNPNKVVTTFWPLWAGAVPPDRVAALARLARDPACFNRHHPFPSLSADSPEFKPGGNYWLGSVWAPTNHAALKGFWRAGERTLAREFTQRHLARMAEVFAATDGVLWENYCSEKSERGSWSQKNYSWTAASPITLLLEVMIGLEAEASHMMLHWHLPEENGVGVENYPLGNATVNLRHERDDHGRRVTVQSDADFILHLTGAGRDQEVSIAGRQEVRIPI